MEKEAGCGVSGISSTHRHDRKKITHSIGEIVVKIVLTLLAFLAPMVLNAQWTKTGISDNAGKITGFATVGTSIFASVTAITSTQTGGVYVSKDGGSSWQTANNGIPNKTVTSIATLGSSLFISTDGDGVLISTDEGNNWTKSNTGFVSLKVRSIMANGTKLYAGTDAGLFVSSNNGSDWTTLTSSLSNQSILAFVVTPTAIVLTNQGYPNYYYSTDDGSTWNDASKGLPMGTSSCFARYGSDILNGTLNGIYSSSDNGASWKSLGVTGSIYSITDVAGNIFSGTGVLRGISYSSDNGKTWVTNNDGIDQLSLTISAITRYGSEVLIGSTNSAIFKLTLGSLGLTGVEKQRTSPDEFILDQNYPNPFNPSTIISYSIPSGGHVRIVIYDMLGKELSELVNEPQGAGRHHVTFEANNIPAGVYFYRLSFNASSDVKKLTVLK